MWTRLSMLMFYYGVPCLISIVTVSICYGIMWWVDHEYDEKTGKWVPYKDDDSPLYG